MSPSATGLNDNTGVRNGRIEVRLVTVETDPINATGQMLNTRASLPITAQNINNKNAITKPIAFRENRTGLLIPTFFQ